MIQAVLLLTLLTKHCVCLYHPTHMIYALNGSTDCGLFCQCSEHPLMMIKKCYCHRTEKTGSSIQQKRSITHSFLCLLKIKQKNDSDDCKLITKDELCYTDISDVSPKVQNGLSPDVISTKQGNRTLDSCNSTLLHASKAGKICIVKSILSQRLADVNHRGHKGRTAVMLAVRKGHLAVFDYLVSQRCDLSGVDDLKNNIFHTACIGGNRNIVRKLIDSGKYDIEGTHKNGNTPLMRAAYFGRREVFDLLVSEGCNRTAANDKGNNILHFTCLGGHVDMINYVLSLEIFGQECRGQYGRTPIMMTANYGRQEAFDVLLARGCNITKNDYTGDSILHIACLGGNKHIIEVILSKHIVPIDERGCSGRPPVVVAAFRGHLEAVALLKRRGADMKMVDDWGNSAMHLACDFGSVETVKYLLSLGTGWLKDKNILRQTPVDMAKVAGHKAIVDLLNHVTQ